MGWGQLGQNDTEPNGLGVDCRVLLRWRLGQRSVRSDLNVPEVVSSLWGSKHFWRRILMTAWPGCRPP
jgi:hypothetical protein